MDRGGRGATGVDGQASCVLGWARLGRVCRRLRTACQSSAPRTVPVYPTAVGVYRNTEHLHTYPQKGHCPPGPSPRHFPPTRNQNKARMDSSLAVPRALRSALPGPARGQDSACFVCTYTAARDTARLLAPRRTRKDIGRWLALGNSRTACRGDLSVPLWTATRVPAPPCAVPWKRRPKSRLNRISIRDLPVEMSGIHEAVTCAAIALR